MSEACRLQCAWCLTAVLAAVGCAPAGATSSEGSAAQFLVDKQAELAVIVRVVEIETRWVVIEHGDHIPVLRVASSVMRPIAGPRTAAGERLVMMHLDYSDMIFEEISPPPVVGYEYLVLADSVESAGWEWLERVEVDWLVHAQGAHRLRGAEGARFIFWQDRRHALEELETLLENAEPISLEVIDDPETRLRVAQQRLAAAEPGAADGFVRSMTALFRPAAGGPGEVPFRQWYEALAVLRRLGSQDEHREVVVAGLTGLMPGAGDHQRLAIAMLLAELGDGSGKEALEAALEEADMEVNSDPGSGYSLPGRLLYDDSSVAGAAHALGLLGGSQGLRNPEVNVQLAAADGLGAAGGEEVLAVLRSLARELDQTVAALEESGKLAAERERGDYQQRHPHAWVKAHQLLARLGDDQSLRKLVAANQVDRRTYPEGEAAVRPRLEPGTWSWAPHRWPDLGGALVTADADPTRLLARLESLYGEATGWQDEVLLSVRAWARGEPAEPEAPSVEAARAETLARIDRLLTAEAVASRAEGLAGAGFNQVDEHFDLVVEAALEGAGVEKRAAMYGLGFYGRELATADLRRLCTEGPLGARVSGLELATRRRPERFAAEAMQILSELHAVRVEGAESGMDEFERSSTTRQFPRILARLCRGEIPQALLAGLRTGGRAQRLAVVEALGLGGNPTAAAALRTAAQEADPELSRAALWALERLGPEE